MAALIECHNLTKQFDSKIALNNINLNIQKGKIIGLLGPNGSGKTTFMKLAAGLLIPNEGEIFINGKKPGFETKKYVSFLSEKAYFENWMRVSDMVSYFKDFYCDFDNKKALEMFKSLNIDIKCRLRSMSKGTIEKYSLYWQ